MIVAYEDALIRGALADHVRSCDHDVFEAASSDEALAMIADQERHVHALLCDVAIGGSLSGFGLAIEARDLRPGLRVMLTGSIGAAAGAAVDLCTSASHEAREAFDLAERIKRELQQREACVN